MGALLDFIYAALVIYFLYKLIVGLILPVSRASADMHAKVKRMQEEQVRRQQQNTAKPTQAKVSSDQEYIDFEEIKE